MSHTSRPEQTADDGVIFNAKPASDAKPACMALVPVVPSVQWSHPAHLQRADSIFVTQLIATAEHDPQTRALRRATLADAQSAYGATRRHTTGAGIRTRQII